MASHSSRRTFMKRTTLAGVAGSALISDFGSGLEHAVEAQTLSSSPADLRITRVSSAYMLPDHMFIKIETNQGITGYGEGVDAVIGTHYLAGIMSESLIGKNPLDVYRLFEDIRKSGIFYGAQAGIYVSVLSAIEIALWDVAGKALGLPVYRLLGGKFRHKIHTYTHPRNTDRVPELMADACLDARNAGYDAIKFSVDWRDDPNKQDTYNNTANNRELERMVNTVAAIREAVGPYMDVIVEMHTRFDLPTAIRYVKALEPYNPLWIEEPVPAENMDTLREITMSSNIPVCVGENLFLIYQFEALLEIKAADIIMPDVQKCGGIGEAQRIATIANAHYVPFAPHMVATPLGMMATAHVCASVPNFLMMESFYENYIDIWEDVVFDCPPIIDSFLTLSEKPGIGIALNEDGLRKHAVPDVPFFE